EDTRVLERIRGLARPTGEPTFRERLRRDFVFGTFGQRPRAVAIAPRRPVRFLAWAAGLSAAAAVAIVLAVLNQPPGWTARTTGGRFHGARLAITTPDATIHVTGTTLAVIAEATGTCVCVLEGTAHVAPHQGKMTRVTPGSSCEVARGGRKPKRGEMRDAERPRLVDLRDRMQAVMN